MSNICIFKIPAIMKTLVRTNWIIGEYLEDMECEVPTSLPILLIEEARKQRFLKQERLKAPKGEGARRKTGTVPKPSASRGETSVEGRCTLVKVGTDSKLVSERLPTVLTKKSQVVIHSQQQQQSTGGENGFPFDFGLPSSLSSLVYWYSFWVYSTG